MTDWNAILAAHGPAVWRTARRLAGNDADADECYQEAFVDALAFARTHAVRDWRAVLVRLATARGIDLIRARKRRRAREGPPAAGDDAGHPGPSPPAGAEAAELSQRLRDALAELPPRQAQAFCLTCLDGWSHADVAIEMAASAGSVGVLVHRARQRLGALLQPIREVAR